MTERAVALGKLGFSYGAGVILGPFIGGQISKYFSQKAAMMSAAFFSVFAIIFVITFIPKFTRKIGWYMYVKISLLALQPHLLMP